jgi:ABC-2 type transport system permease protein
VKPRLFWQILSLEARTRMSYRGDFWLNAVVGFLVELGVVWFLWQAMFLESGREVIGGRTFEGMVLYYLGAILVGKLVRGVIWEAAISQDIYTGGLTRYLVFPASYLPFKYAQRLGALGPGLVQFVLFGTVAYLWLDLEARITLGGVAMALPCIVVASFLYFLIDYSIHLVAFWADNVWSLDVGKWFLVSILGGYMLPLSVFPEWAQTVLEYLPFRVFFDLPVRTLLGELSVGEWARGIVLSLGWCLVYMALGRLLWWRGRLQYTGVGI